LKELKKYKPICPTVSKEVGTTTFSGRIE